MGKKVYLRWNNLEVSVPPPKPSLLDRARSAIRGQDGEGVQPAVQPEGRKILRKINGVARPGDLIALMGSSGAGKTTLLNTLSRRNIGSLDVDGEILVNGRPVGKNIGSVSAYVQQEDVFLTTLTVREHLQFQAMLRMNTEIPAAKRYERVEEVIQELGLQGCSNAKIGNNTTVQGISGGERKRLSFASEILEDPPLLFADEPTSGLDSFKAGSVVQALQNLANKGRTIICTIHQPPSEVFALFNRLMLLAEGRMAYLGSMSGAVSHFGSLGYSCPELYNPADFFVFTLAIVPGKEEECREKVGKINDAYSLIEKELRKADMMTPAPSRHAVEASPVVDTSSVPTLMLTELKAGDELEDDNVSIKSAVMLPRASLDIGNAMSVTPEEALAAALDSSEGGELDPADLETGDIDNMKRPLSHMTSYEVSGSAIPKESLQTQAKWLAWRSWMTTFREPLVVKVRVAQTVFLAVLCGLIYLRLDHNSSRVQNVAGALFFIVMQMVFGVVLPTVQIIPAEIPVFLREHASRMYRSTIYVLSKTLAGLPFNIVLPVVFTTISYWMIGFNEDVGRFFTACGITILTAFTSESYGYLISSLSRSPEIALSITSPMIIPLMLFGGLLLNSESTPVYFIWVEKISFVKYAFHAIMINEFHDAPNPACPSMSVNGTMMTSGRCFPDGNAILDFYGMKPSEFSLNIGVLFALGVILRILATLIFIVKTRKN